MIAALYIERDDGVLVEVSGAGYRRTEIVSSKTEFPRAEADWGHVTHMVVGESEDELP